MEKAITIEKLKSIDIAKVTNLTKQEIIDLIRNRIKTEHEKYHRTNSNWAEIAATKIFSNLVEEGVIEKEV